LIDAAEAEFSDRGFAGASLRGIMRSAGANPAAVHYHFGSRDELIRAVLDRTLGPLNDRRLELLQGLQLRCKGLPIEVGELVVALVMPDLEALRDLQGRNPRGARLIGLIYAHPTAFVKERVEEHFRPVAEQFMPEFARSVPDIPDDEVAWRVRWCVFGTLIALLSAEADDAPLDLDDLDGSARRLASFIAGGLTAPMATEGDRSSKSMPTPR
jgi:AcrR family transcriptional regulator